MAKPLKPIHPKFIIKGMTLFTHEGVEVEVMLLREVAGRFEFTTVHKVSAKNVFNNYVYDMHDYTGEENPVPQLFRKSPLGKKKR